MAANYHMYKTNHTFKRQIMLPLNEYTGEDKVSSVHKFLMKTWVKKCAEDIEATEITDDDINFHKCNNDLDINNKY